MPINSVADLRAHLELAIKVELSTIPPYLYAMYSIEDATSEAALLIRSIAAEEMLHAALATNILLAVGGDPDFTSTAFIPTYPGWLPHHKPPLRMELAPCTLDVVKDRFLVIERPEAPGARPEADEFETLGQFYEALEQSIHRLAAETDLMANPQVDRQMADPNFYIPVEFDDEDTGGLGVIDSVDTACEAIEIIVHQGEGLTDEKWADESHRELTHYHKLLRLVDGETDLGAVRPLAINPTTAGYPPEIRDISNLFNAAYRRLFYTMADIFGDQGDKKQHVGTLYRLMARTLSQVGRYLTTRPLGDGTMAGPTFEVYDFGADDPDEHLAALEARVVADHPELAGVLPR